MEVYKILAKEFLAEHADALRKLRKLTQEQMAEQLRITSRAYGDLERGKYCFSAIALLFFLLMMEDEEVKAFLLGFREKVYTLEHKDTVQNIPYAQQRSAGFEIPVIQ